MDIQKRREIDLMPALSDDVSWVARHKLTQTVMTHRRAVESRSLARDDWRRPQPEAI